MDEEKRKKINEYRKDRQVSFIIPKKEQDIIDKKEFVKKHGMYKHRDIYYMGLNEAYKKLKGSESLIDFKIKQQEQLIHKLKNELAEAERLLNQYQQEKEKDKERSNWIKETSFVNKFKQDYNNFKENQKGKDLVNSEIIRKFCEANYDKINGAYEKQNIYKNSKLNDPQRAWEKEDRVNEYVQIFMNHIR